MEAQFSCHASIGQRNLELLCMVPHDPSPCWQNSEGRVNQIGKYTMVCALKSSPGMKGSLLFPFILYIFGLVGTEHDQAKTVYMKWLGAYLEITCA